MNPGSHTPTSERHVRELGKLEPAEQRIAWERALETAPNGKVTAAHVRRIVDQLKPRSVSADALFPGPPASPDAVRVAMYVLLDAALEILADELRTDLRQWARTSDREVQEAARLLLESPLLKGAATMVAQRMEG